MYFDFISKQFRETDKNPDKPAVCGSDKDISWQELQKISTQLCILFKQLGIPHAHPIILYGHKEHLFPAAILACMQADITYIPIDIVYPPERVENIIRQTGTQVAVNCTGKPLPFSISAEITTSLSCQIHTPYNFTNKVYPLPSGEVLQYIMFTSGSTGEPKGVMLSQKSILTFVDWALRDFGFSENDVFLNQAPFSFDVSLCDVINALGRGATLVLISADAPSNQDAFILRLQKYACSVWTSTPSFAFIFLRHPEFLSSTIPALKKFLFMGEELSTQTCRCLFRNFPQCAIYNAYGPTEASIVTTWIEITPELLEENPLLPIGYPRPGSTLLIDKKSALDAEGELIICGPHVADGYFKKPVLTAEKFFLHNGQKAYRTGDLSEEKNGLFYFYGRNDEQIKLHGYRIELNEISTRLAEHPQIENAVCIPLTRNREVKKIIAFVTLKNADENKPDIKEQLLSSLQGKLPYYMIPADLKVLKEFPVNSSHKIDKKKLAEMYMQG